MAGSGDKQTQAKLCRVEINEVAVAFDPRPDARLYPGVKQGQYVLGA
jgi:hypothetical protein